MFGTEAAADERPQTKLRSHRRQLNADSRQRHQSRFLIGWELWAVMIGCGPRRRGRQPRAGRRGKTYCSIAPAADQRSSGNQIRFSGRETGELKLAARGVTQNRRERREGTVIQPEKLSSSPPARAGISRGSLRPRQKREKKVPSFLVCPRHLNFDTLAGCRHSYRLNERPAGGTSKARPGLLHPLLRNIHILLQGLLVVQGAQDRQQSD